jgi:hypothetical protein
MAVLQDGEWNPLAERWTEKDLQDVLAQEAKVQQALNKMRIGTINSSNFLNCKVEQKV